MSFDPNPCEACVRRAAFAVDAAYPRTEQCSEVEP